MGLGDHQVHTRILQHEGKSFGGVGRVEGHEASTTAQDGEHGHDEVEAAVHAQAHRLAGTHAALHQGRAHRVYAVLQRAVVQLLIAKHERGTLPKLHSHLIEQGPDVHFGVDGGLALPLGGWCGGIGLHWPITHEFP